jgi:hypothetical protein
MRGRRFVGLVMVAILIGEGVGYFASGSTSHQSTQTITQTITKTTTITLGGTGPVDCGYNKGCYSAGPSGQVLSLSILSTTIAPNGSLLFQLAESNPTTNYINLTKTNGWFLPGLTDLYPCYGGFPPYGLSVFLGYDTLQNISAGSNLIHSTSLLCYNMPYNITMYSIHPLSSQVDGLAAGKVVQSNLGYSNVIYAIKGDVLPDGGNTSELVLSLGSSMPNNYTIVAGDEWGDVAVLHFEVKLAA